MVGALICKLEHESCPPTLVGLSLSHSLTLSLSPYRLRILSRHFHVQKNLPKPSTWTFLRCLKLLLTTVFGKVILQLLDDHVAMSSGCACQELVTALCGGVWFFATGDLERAQEFYSRSNVSLGKQVSRLFSFPAL